eukprot:4803524-Alexandrium_andersonii.AAC.1
MAWWAFGRLGEGAKPSRRQPRPRGSGRLAGPGVAKARLLREAASGYVRLGGVAGGPSRRPPPPRSSKVRHQSWLGLPGTGAGAADHLATLCLPSATRAPASRDETVVAAASSARVEYWAGPGRVLAADQ